MLRRAIRVVSYVVFPITMGLVIIADPMVDVLLTGKWKNSVPFIQILSLASIVGLVGDISLQVIKAIGRSDVLLKLEFIKKPVYLVLLIVGVKHSVIAIAFTMLVYALYSVFVNLRPLKKLIQYGYKEQMSDIKSALLLSAFMYIACSIWNYVEVSSLFRLCLQIITGVTVYVCTSYFFKVESFLYILSFIKRKRQIKTG